jgi:nitrile hydratase
VNGIHDLGGKHGFGPVPRAGREPGGPVFDAAWEGRVRAMTALLIARGAFNVDTFRHAIERLDPLAYLRDGYFGRWLGAVELLVRELGPALARGRVPGPGARREIAAAPRFAVGAWVRTRNHQPAGHTRLPGYARARRGRIVLHHGAWVFPDSNAHERGECPEHLYAVRFEAGELWGGAAEPGSCVHVDLFESYLEPA